MACGFISQKENIALGVTKTKQPPNFDQTSPTNLNVWLSVLTRGYEPTKQTRRDKGQAKLAGDG